MLSVCGEDICSTAMCCTCTGIAYVAEWEMPGAWQNPGKLPSTEKKWRKDVAPKSAFFRRAGSSTFCRIVPISIQAQTFISL
jgi:hypothetical protein